MAARRGEAEGRCCQLNATGLRQPDLANSTRRFAKRPDTGERIAPSWSSTPRENANEFWSPRKTRQRPWRGQGNSAKDPL